MPTQVATKWCGACKGTEDLVVRYTNRLGKKYHICNPCNNKRPKNKETLKRASYKFFKKNPWRHAVYERVRRAIKSGKLIRPDKCSRCDKPGKPQAHHKDYSKPLEVVWLCVKCHRKHHS